jgi:hypothetical protein
MGSSLRMVILSPPAINHAQERNIPYCAHTIATLNVLKQNYARLTELSKDNWQLKNSLRGP